MDQFVGRWSGSNCLQHVPIRSEPLLTWINGTLWTNEEWQNQSLRAHCRSWTRWVEWDVGDQTNDDDDDDGDNDDDDDEYDDVNDKKVGRDQKGKRDRGS